MSGAETVREAAASTTASATSQMNVLGRAYPSGLDSDAIRAVVDVAREHAARTDESAEFPTDVLDKMRSTGLLGILVPAEYGGQGGTVADVLTVSHAISRECLSSGMIFAMHHQQVAALVGHAGAVLRERLLPRIARGEVYLASITTEPGKGGHLLSAQAALEDAGQRLHLDRTAPIVTGGEHADGYLVTMRSGGSEHESQVSLVYADARDVTVASLGSWDPLGMRGTRSVPMRITGAVPRDNVVGEHGRFRDVVVATFGPLAHLGWATCWLGAAGGALSRTIELLRSSEERKRRDVSSELLRHRLSRVRQRLDVVHALIAHALRVHEDGDAPLLAGTRAQLLINAVKLTASEQCTCAVDELVELVGMRHGYLRGSPLRLEQSLRDLRSASLNYSNDRLHAADGALTLLDPEVGYV